MNLIVAKDYVDCDSLEGIHVYKRTVAQDSSMLILIYFLNIESFNSFFQNQIFHSDVYCN